MMIINEIANNLSEDLFNVGKDQCEIPHRIAFMGGDYASGNEKMMGGLNKQAFADFVESSLKRYLIDR